ncbi:electron transport complex subunit RsxC [Vibrio tapetis subsp. quintayensis]|uniref:electron transport complex subunit RsxC n=1 Tax=Vibrio tapetis TaxID=52443 RepID=UPI0025B5C726|nr:electron transport complex subunit RsxC [Vibrio tapetis]MDN3680487.1 electron transport complex subunit RsxC [Vibrio tapetis subsp. quintayensis]
MLSLIEKIRSGYLWDFPGGVHPPENKKQSASTRLQHASLPTELVIPIKQHIGKAGDLCVKVGDYVLKGQPLTECSLSFMLPIHAPTSGTITAIEPRVSAHPSGLPVLSIVLSPDGDDRWIALNTISALQSETPESLIEMIRQAGISGMGGAGFPTAKKIQSGVAKTEILIINAAECEPYITADDALMQHYADEIIQGIEVIEHILKPKLTIIGIEDNKPEAIAAIQKAATFKDYVIRVIPTKYPSGGEKQLIKVLTNMEVPKGSIPADIGVLVQNVGSIYATKRAVFDGEPLIERLVTLTGKAFKQPRNVWARIGTPVQHLLEEFDYSADKKSPRLILGGPMMGFTLPTSLAPVTKTTNCILAPTRKEIPANRYEMECIRCSQCAEACPVSLLPQQLQWYSKSQEYDKCEELNLSDCIECGACAYVCPSEIPLVQYYREAKAEIRTRKEESLAAERARQRFEERNARLERDKAQRENRFKKAAEQRRNDMKKSDGDDAVAAAIARVKAQQAKAAPASEEVKPAVAAAIARAKAKQAAAKSNGENLPDNSEMMKLREERKQQARARKAEKEQQSEAQTEPPEDDKKSAVAAAIARAKARKAQQAEAKPEQAEPAVSDDPKTEAENNSEQSVKDPKKAAVAAAIARAKARKAKQAEAKPEQLEPAVSETPTSVTEIDSEQPTEDPKKAAVAAAIARAKARKAKQAEAKPEQAEPPVSEAPTSVTQVDSEQPAEDPKKAAVAAAIARAKARKAKQAEAKLEQDEPTVSETPTSVTEVDSEQPTEDPKKAAVAAAIARAKARKAKQAEAKLEQAEPAISETPTSVTEVDSEQPTEDPKKAAVAAAIARAKARKAAQAELKNQIQDGKENE